MNAALYLTVVGLFAMADPVLADYRSWKHSGSVYILTTPEGVVLPSTTSIKGFPLLVRLHKDVFNFSQAKPSGADLRFSSNVGDPLAYQIEEWDAAAGIASVWVRIPKIQGNARQEIKLYWGNADAVCESNGKAVFGETNGYLSVWHMNDPVKDEVGTLTSADSGTTAAVGMIGCARHFLGQKGIFCGDKIPDYPAGSSSHSTEAWIRAEKSNATIISWGNEGGGRGSKVRMQLRSPPYLHIDSNFSDVKGDSRLPLGEWVHVVHTYERGDGKVYLNGRLDSAAKPLLNIKSPARLWIGSWYNNYDFVGEIDEVRISMIARSADWIRLQYENQKPLQTLDGPLVQPGNSFSVSESKVVVAEGKKIMLTAKAGGALKVYWTVERDGRETVVATVRFSHTFDAGRVVGDQSAKLRFKAIYSDEVRTKEIPILIQEDIPEPIFTLRAPAMWDGRQTIEVVPRIDNLNEMRTRAAGRLNFNWTVSGIAVIKETSPGKLVLKRAQNSGAMTITVAIDNGGRPATFDNNRGQRAGKRRLGVSHPGKRGEARIWTVLRPR